MVEDFNFLKKIDLIHPRRSLKEPYFSDPVNIRMLLPLSFQNDVSPSGFSPWHTRWDEFCEVLDKSDGVQSKKFMPDCSHFSPWLYLKSRRSDNRLQFLTLDFSEVFDIDRLAPQFNGLKRAEYVAVSGIYRVMFPISGGLPLSKFPFYKHRLQRWAYGKASQPKPRMSSFKVGQICDFPAGIWTGENSRVRQVVGNSMLDQWAIESHRFPKNCR